MTNSPSDKVAPAQSEKTIPDHAEATPEDVADPGKIRLGGAFRLPTSK